MTLTLMRTVKTFTAFGIGNFGKKKERTWHHLGNLRFSDEVMVMRILNLKKLIGFIIKAI